MDINGVCAEYEILIDYEDLRYCPPDWKSSIELRKGEVIEVLFVEAAGSGKYFADKNNAMYRGHYLASYQKQGGEYIYMIDFELLNLIAKRI